MVVDRTIAESPVLYQIILLGYGTMIAKHCTDHVACPVEYIQVLLLYLTCKCNKGSKMKHRFLIFLNSSSTNVCLKLILKTTSRKSPCY